MCFKQSLGSHHKQRSDILTQLQPQDKYKKSFRCVERSPGHLSDIESTSEKLVSVYYTHIFKTVSIEHL